MSIYKGTRAERYRSRMRSLGKESAMNAARKASALLDKYVLARKGDLIQQPVILWGRVAVVAVSAVIILYLIIRFFAG